MGDFSPSDFTGSFELPPALNGNLRRIPVALTVTLASKKMAIGKILELVPGAILRFDKSCGTKLDLEVASRRIAQGDCVDLAGRAALNLTSFIAPGAGLE